jgi:hypothetical protein
MAPQKVSEPAGRRSPFTSPILKLALIHEEAVPPACTPYRTSLTMSAPVKIFLRITDAWAAVIEMRERSKLLFNYGPDPEWYVLPHAEGLQNPDPTVPMSGWRTAWRNLTRAINCMWQVPKAGNDLRKQNLQCRSPRRHEPHRWAAIPRSPASRDNRLAEGQASEQTIRSIAGHKILRAN